MFINRSVARLAKQVHFRTNKQKGQFYSSFESPRKKGRSVRFWIWLKRRSLKFWIWLVVILGVLYFIGNDLYQYRKLEGFRIASISVSESLSKKGLTDDAFRTLLMQKTEVYFANITEIPTKTVAVNSELYSPKSAELNDLSFNLEVVSFTYRGFINFLGQKLVHNKQEIITIAIVEDETKYTAVLKVGGQAAIEISELKADYYSDHYALNFFIVAICKSLLEVSNPSDMLRYYSITNQSNSVFELLNRLKTDENRNTFETNHNIFAGYLDFGDFTSIEDSVAKHLKRYPNDIYVYNLTLVNSIYSDSSEPCINRLIDKMRSIDSTYPYLALNAGLFHFRRKRFDSALHYFNASRLTTNALALDLDDNLYSLRYSSISAYRNKRYQLADSLFQAYCDFNVASFFSDPFQDTSFVNIPESQPDIPKNCLLGTYLAVLRSVEKKPKRALTIIEQNISDSISNTNIDLYAALAYINIGKYGKSDSILYKISSKQPNHPIALALLADSYWRREDFSKALQYGQLSLRYYPTYKFAFYPVVKACLALSNYDKAVDYCYQFLSYFPNDGFAHETLGSLFRMQRRYNNSQWHYNKAIDYYSRTNKLYEKHVRRMLKSCISERNASFSQPVMNEELELRSLMNYLQRIMAAGLIQMNSSEEFSQEILGCITDKIFDKIGYQQFLKLPFSQQSKIIRTLANECSTSDAEQRSKKSGAYFDLAWIAYKAGDVKSAMTYCDTGLLIDPEEANLQAVLGFCLIVNDEYQQATSRLMNALSNYKNLPDESATRNIKWAINSLKELRSHKPSSKEIDHIMKLYEQALDDFW